MTRIRILLAALPALLRDLLNEALAGEPDVEVVADVGSVGNVASRSPLADLTRLVRELHPDIVVVSLGTTGAGAAAAVSELRDASPSTAMLAVTAKGDHATLWTSHREPVELTDITVGALVQAIRDHAAVKGSTKLPPA